MAKTTDYTISGQNITILANKPASGDYTTTKKGQIKISFLTEAKDVVSTFTPINSGSDILTYITGPTGARWFNPLAFGAELAIINGGRGTSVVGIATATGGDSHSYSTAIEQLEVQDVYALAPMTRQSAQILAFASHATAMSLPANKLERISFGSPINSYTLATPPTNAQKVADATSIGAASAAINNKRHFSIFPDVAWVRVSTHLATLKTTFITAVFGANMPAPRFASKITLSGVTYNPGDSMSDTVIGQ